MWQSPDPADVAALAAPYAHAWSLYQAGMLEDALTLLESAHVGQSGLAACRILLLRGRILTDQVFHANRGYPEALTTLGAVRAQAVQLNDERASADAVEALALADYYRALQDDAGDYRNLLARFQESQMQREALGDGRGMAESLFHVGLMHERLGEAENARAAYERAYALADEHECPIERSYAARHLGSLRFERADLDGAARYFAESLALRQTAGFLLGVPLAHIAIGEVLLAQGDESGAGTHYEQAFVMAEGMQSPLALVLALLALADLARTRGDAQASRGYAQRALTYAQSATLPLGVRAAASTLDALQ